MNLMPQLLQGVLGMGYRVRRSVERRGLRGSCDGTDTDAYPEKSVADCAHGKGYGLYGEDRVRKNLCVSFAVLSEAQKTLGGLRRSQGGDSSSYQRVSNPDISGC